MQITIEAAKTKPSAFWRKGATGRWSVGASTAMARPKKECEIEELRSEIENLKEMMRALGKENGGGR